MAGFEFGKKGAIVYISNEITGIVVIPFHGSKDLPKGTELSILKKAGLR